MRWALLAASVAALSAGTVAPALAQQDKQETGTLQNAVVQEGVEPAQELRVTSPPNAAPDRTYEDPSAALLEADVDYLIREGRRLLANNEAGTDPALWTLAVFSDNFAAGRFDDARAVLANAPRARGGRVAELGGGFVLAAV